MSHNHEHGVGRSPARRFARHAVEMLVAMVAGMVVLEPVWSFAWPGLSASVTAHALVMATNMSLGMAVWMGIRGHGPASIAEMAVAMYVPFLAVLPVYWTWALDGTAVLTAGHLLMVPAMLGAMLRRRHEYGW